MTLDPLHEELLDLRDRVYDLTELNKKLLEALGPTGAIFPSSWGLNAQEATALALLWIERGIVDQGAIHQAISSSKSNKADSPIVRVVVYRIRKKLKHLGIEIMGLSKIGYEMTEESRDIIDRSCAARMGFFKKISPRIALDRPSRKSENIFNGGVDSRI